jgi:hypothetical protein
MPDKKRKSARRKTRKTMGGIKKRGGALSDEYMTTMYDNMWTFMNLDMITSVLSQAGCEVRGTHVDDIDDEESLKDPSFWGTICQKGDEDAGHYVYIDRTGQVWGTYEMNLTDDRDDGMCHGAAIAAALSDCGVGVGPLYPEPNAAQKKKNYQTIRDTYITIIENHWWDRALHRFFYNDVTWNKNETKTRETATAYTALTS